MIVIKHHRYPIDRGVWLNHGQHYGSYWMVMTNWRWLQRLAGWRNVKRSAVVAGSLAFWKSALFNG